MLIYDQIELTCPDGFHEMTEDEKNALDFWGGSDGVCLSDPQRHMTISIGIKKNRLGHKQAGQSVRSCGQNGKDAGKCYEQIRL